MSARLAEPVALVTGGARGLGLAIGGRLARGEHRVVLADVDTTAVTQAASDLGSDGLVVEAVTLDVTREAEVAAAVEHVLERLGRLDVLVCSAAIETRARIEDTDDEAWQRILDVNVKGPFLCMKHAIPAMTRHGGGSVILLGSTLAHIGTAGYAAYCASKGALANLAKQAAIEHAPDGVRVNLVSPSACDTGLFMQTAQRADDPQAVIDLVTRTNPMGRLGRAEEVCETVAFLASPGAAYISGAAIPVDGGLAARRT